MEREALAVIFGLHRFHQYLFGREFVLVSDHKPLVGLFGENTPLPPMASARIHRWAMILSSYSYKLQYNQAVTSVLQMLAGDYTYSYCRQLRKNNQRQFNFYSNWNNHLYWQEILEDGQNKTLYCLGYNIMFTMAGLISH